MRRIAASLVCVLAFGAHGVFAAEGEPADGSTAESEAGTATPSNDAAEPDLRVYVFDCGKIFKLDPQRFLPGVEDAVEPIDLVDRCYLIQHPEGTLLWDTGLPSALSSWWVRTLAWVTSFGGINARVDRTLVEQLEELGLTPADIDYVAFSHLHTDHSGNANLFAKSTWLVQEPEFAVAFDGSVDGFDKSYYDALENAPRVVLDGDHDVFGDGRVRILSAPGHTPGHQCLLVRLAERGPILLSGDLYHTKRNRELRVAPSFNTDREQTVESMERIERILEETGAELLIQHDIESNRDIPLSPVALQ